MSDLRNEFLRYLETVKYDWGFRIRELEDDVGLITVRYSVDKVTLLVEKVIVGQFPKVDAPTLFNNLNKTRNRLVSEAFNLWRTRMDRFMLRRRVTWKEALKHAGTHNKAQLLVMLSLIRSGAYGAIRMDSLPPVLSQQNDAVNLPRVDKPGHPDRVYLIQLTKGG